MSLVSPTSAKKPLQTYTIQRQFPQSVITPVKQIIVRSPIPSLSVTKLIDPLPLTAKSTKEDSKEGSQLKKKENKIEELKKTIKLQNIEIHQLKTQERLRVNEIGILQEKLKQIITQQSNQR